MDLPCSFYFPSYYSSHSLLSYGLLYCPPRLSQSLCIFIYTFFLPEMPFLWVLLMYYTCDHDFRYFSMHHWLLFFFPVWLLLQALNFQPIYFLDWSQLRCFIDISHLQWLNQNICTQPHDMFLICSYHGVHSRLLEVSFDTSICPKYQQVLLDVCQYILKLCMLCPSNHHFSSQSL